MEALVIIGGEKRDEQEEEMKRTEGGSGPMSLQKASL